MDLIFKNKKRIIWALYLIAVPMFLLSLYVILNIEAYEGGGNRKEGVAYFLIVLAPMLGTMFYFGDKALQTRQLKIDDLGIHFGTEPYLIRFIWKNIKTISIDENSQRVFFDFVRASGPFPTIISELNIGHYDIELDAFIEVLKIKQDTYKFEVIFI
ncbi:hypothetical protein OE749_07330 [Aestuariibacter sp. AA17]|uniref:Uncharacterized protein n=1 Tax=Fluctibacter corallii TaxID=2984329 RepID=A0ABT3A752_9ALTE|nr:hypothetical protein [Aestuariibacter sp. AA17]MCV2884501.1 hypothetical protein [Aestuariibacter sp. AA17]